MNWTEFRKWATDELGFDIGDVGGEKNKGGGQNMAKVLGLDYPGSGHSREYGPAQQCRLRVYLQVRQLLGWERVRGHHRPPWLWDLLRVAEDFGRGWLVVKPWRTGVEISWHREVPEWDPSTSMLVVPVLGVGYKPPNAKGVRHRQDCLNDEPGVTLCICDPIGPDLTRDTRSASMGVDAPPSGGPRAKGTNQ